MLLAERKSLRNVQFVFELMIVVSVVMLVLGLIMREALFNEKVSKSGECLRSNEALANGTNELLQRLYEYYFTTRADGTNFVFSPVGLYRVKC